MNRFIRLRLLAMLLCLPFLLIFISGCGSSSQKKDEPPVYSPLQVLVPEATGKETIGSSPMILDVSNISQGYFIAQSDSSDLTCSLQIISPSGALYSYFIAPGESATVTFTEGSGDYTITGYQQVQGDQYAALYSETVTVQLENDFLPFLYPNQYVNFTPDSKASQLALSLIDEDTVDVDALQQIYDYVVSNLTYDYEKADTVTTGYLPDVDAPASVLIMPRSPRPCSEAVIFHANFRLVMPEISSMPGSMYIYAPKAGSIRQYPLKEIPGHLWILPLIPTAMTKKLFRITLEMKAITLYNSHVNGKGDFL